MRRASASALRLHGCRSAASAPCPAAAAHRFASSSSSSSAAAAAAQHDPRAAPAPRRPGARNAVIDEMLRVDHAGEFGAVNIYKGQLAVLGDKPIGDELRHMLKQEEEHLRNCEELIPERRVRPTALLPLWGVAGYTLGVLSALAGEKAAMACTVAVETVIGGHYNDQLRTLHAPEFKNEEDAKLRAIIKQHRDEELEHLETGIEKGAEQAPFVSVFSAVVKTGCQAAIWVAKKI